ncbi:MAG: peptidase C13 [Pseudomonadota bacterium]
MKRMQGLIVLILIPFFMSWAAFSAAEDAASAGREKAYQTLQNRLLNQDAKARRVYVFQEKTGQAATLSSWRSEITLSGGPGWLFFIDDVPQANWEHACRYVLVSENGDLNVVTARTPPRDMTGFEELTSWLSPSSDASPKLSVDKTLAADAESRASTPAAHRYAVIISGGYNQWNNYLRYWNDCSFFFTTLKQNGFLDDNIYVLMSDGTDPEVDRSDGESSPLDLDNDGLPDIRYSATKANISLVFDELAGKLGPDDILYLFTTDHGGPGDGNPLPYDVPDVILYLWGETITGAELAAEVNKVDAGVVAGIFEQCFSGGLVEVLAGPNRVLMSASRWWELSYAMKPDYIYDEFSYYATQALADPSFGDSNGDGLTVLEEAYLYALSKDIIQSEEIDELFQENMGEHPSYHSDPWDLGRKLSLLGLNHAAPAPVYAGYVQNEISAPYPKPGRARNWHADNAVWSHDLAFAFPFGGAWHRTIQISSNGVIYFASPDKSGKNSVDGLTQALAAAPLWDDLTTKAPENDIYIDANLKYATVSWDAKTKVDGRPVNVAARLYADGTIKFYYGEGNRHTSLIDQRDKTIGVSLGGQAHLSLRNGASVLDQSPGVAYIPAFKFNPASDSQNTGCFLSTLKPEQPGLKKERGRPGSAGDALTR